MHPNPTLWALIFGLAVGALILLLSLLTGVCVALAGRSYGDKLQKRYQEKLRQLLPGKDCGQCGCENCDRYARGVLFGVEAENACPYAEDDTPQKMLALVKEMQLLMEDPKPIPKRKKRSFLFRKANK
ncbi:MAG: hypothetical protein IJO45_00135 [Oscillospiraceae bacterium]|nr:hypothetical protein [Oscillospiraceae bacterium]